MPIFYYGRVGAHRRRFHLVPPSGGTRAVCGAQLHVGPTPKRPAGELCRTCRAVIERRGWKEE